MARAARSKRFSQLSLVAAISALAACDSDPIVVDASPIFECSVVTCGDPSTSPSVWIEGRANQADGGALTGRNARILIAADSTFPTGLTWATPVDAADGRFARSMDVEALCELPLFGRIEVLDASGDTVVQRSRPTHLFDGGLPAGCPFAAASLVDGVPTDTVVARDLYLHST